MRNKFLKGLSVAFAAAMAFTVVAPALTTEAASSKAYVVSEKVSKNAAGATVVTKYTYDSRGRVTKKVETTTDGTSKTVSATTDIANPTSSNTVNTVVTIDRGDGKGPQRYTDTTVIAETYDSVTTTVAVDAKSTTTTNYTYYNSGAKKDKKKSETATTETYYIKGVDSSNSANSYGYYWLDTSDKNVEFTYDSKGNLVKDVTTTTRYGRNWGLALKGNGERVDGTTGEWNDDYVKTLNAGMNDVYGNHDKEKTINTKTYTNNSKGQATRVDVTEEFGSHTEEWNPANTEKVSENEWLSKTEGDYMTWKYNKNGFPTEFVNVYGNKRAYGTPAGYTDSYDADDVAVTFKYTYGKDLQLQKTVITGKQPIGSVSGSILTDVDKYNYDDNNNFVDITNSTNYVTAPVYGNDFTKTRTYHYELKNGSTAKTYEAVTETTVTNGVTDKEYDDSTVSYKLKKISVPSSRLQAVMLDQAKAQTDFEWQK